MIYEPTPEMVAPGVNASDVVLEPLPSIFDEKYGMFRIWILTLAVINFVICFFFEEIFARNQFWKFWKERLPTRKTSKKFVLLEEKMNRPVFGRLANVSVKVTYK